MTIYSLGITPFPIWNQSIVPCPVLTIASWPEYRLCRRHVRWSGIPISLRIFQVFFSFFFFFFVIHTVKDFSIVNEAEVDVLLEFSCFFYDPMNIGNLISGSSSFSKSSLDIWMVSVHILLKPSLENFEHYFARMWNECNFVIVWTFFGIAFFGIVMKTDFFQSCGHCCVFQICWLIEWSTLKESSFRVWNRAVGILSSPLALFVVMLPKANLTSHSNMSGSRWVITP